MILFVNKQKISGTGVGTALSGIWFSITKNKTMVKNIIDLD